MADQPLKPKVRKKRGRLFRFVRACFVLFLLLLLLLVVFHRPIIHYGGRWAAIWFAKREHLTLDLRIEGNLWSRFELHDVRASADGAGPAPLETLSLDHLTADYDLLALVRGDLSGLKEVKIGAVNAIVTPQPPKPKPGLEKPSPPLAEQLRTFLAKPLPTPRVTIERVDLRIKDHGQQTALTGFHLALVPDGAGTIAWERIEIPGAPVFPAARGELRVSADELRLAGLALADEIQLKTLLLSRRADPAVNGLTLDLDTSAGPVHLTARPAATGNQIIAAVHTDLRHVEKLAARFGAKIPQPIDSLNVEVDASVDPANPADGSASVHLRTATTLPSHPAEVILPPIAPFPILIPKLPGDPAQVALQLSLARGSLQITELTAHTPFADFKGNGAFQISPLLAHKGPAPPPLPDGALTYTLTVPDLTRVSLGPPLRGKIDAKGAVTLAQNTAKLTTTLTALDAGQADARIARTIFQLDATALPTAPLPLKTVVANFTLDADQLSSGEIRADRVHAAGKLDALRATLSELVVTRGANEVRAQALATLTEAGQLSGSPEASFTLKIPALAEFGLVVQKQSVTGAITGEGKVTLENNQPRGNLRITGQNVSLGTSRAGDFTLDADTAGGFADLKSLRVQFSPADYLDVKARAAIAPPYAYDATVKLDVRDLKTFEPLLAVLGQKHELAGTVNLDFTGKGDLQAGHSGAAKLNARGVRFDKTNVQEARLAATFAPDRAEISEFFVLADQLRASGRLEWLEKVLKLSGLDVRVSDLPVLTGGLSTPLDPFGKTPLPQDLPITASLHADRLDLSKIFAALKLPPQAEGILTAKLEASGTIASPKIVFDATGRNLRLPPKPGVAAIDQSPILGVARGDFDTSLTFFNNHVTFDASVRQPDLKPLKITAELPLELKPLLEGKKPDVAKLPIKASVNLPSSSLNFIPRLAPAVAKLDATAAISIQASGTIGQPKLDGLVAADVKLARMANASVPPLSNLGIRIRLAGDTITIERFNGETGGGKFTLAGKLNIADPKQPALDLAVKASEVLVVRNDSLLVRVDTDLTLRGPLNAGTAAGRVTVRQSRFSKEIQVLPVVMPGKPKPLPREVSQPTTVSFPNPPLRDWKFDIAIVTQNDDPFQIRGDLAKGKVQVDLRLTGTGLAPALNGAATIDSFRAQLPAAVLTTRRGLVTFSAAEPFQPRLEIEAESVIRGYTVIARIDGLASAPHLDLASEPSLPQQEILSLLTTGSLTAEIGANNSALATRAALLVLRDWYRRVFRKTPPEISDDSKENFMDRFNFDLGAVDPQTGQQEVTAEFRVNDNYFLIGEFEMNRGFSGRLKYLLRFR